MAQRRRIAELIKDEEVEVNTVDSFQGREKDVIIFSVKHRRFEFCRGRKQAERGIHKSQEEAYSCRKR